MRTRPAQNAVKRAREIVLQNEKMIDNLYLSFGLNREVIDKEKTLLQEEDFVENKNWILNDSDDFKIVTSSKFKRYFEDIINSIH